MPITDVNQVTNKQHAVPQNIMDVEFKIIGDLTMRQFFYLLIFSGIAYAFYVQNWGGFLKWPLIFLFVSTGLAFAFLPYQERNLDQWIVNFFKAVYKPTQRIWKKQPQIPKAFAFENLNVVRQELIALTPTSSRRKLEEFLESQNTQKVQDPLDIPEMAYIKKVRAAFATSSATARQTSAASQTTTTAVVEEEIEIIPSPSTPIQTPSPPIEGEKEKVPEETTEQAPQFETQIAAQQGIPPAPEKPILKQPEKPIVQKLDQKPAQIALPVEKAEEQIEQKIVLPESAYEPLEPLTPDRHTGRRFMSLLPKQGEIILPIRGERVIQTTAEQEIEQDIEEKTEQLKQLLAQIKKEEGIEFAETEKAKAQHLQADQPLAASAPAPAQLDLEDVLAKLQKETAQLTIQIEKLKKEIAETQQPQQKTEKIVELKQLETQRQEKSQDFSNIKQKIVKIHNLLFAKDPVDIKEAVAEKPNYQAPPKPEIQTEQPRFSNIRPLTDKPNIISGVVRDQNNTGLESVVLIIKNDKDEPVRAIKTNKLGEFGISTPLTNGTYTIETDKSNRTHLSFDIIKIEAFGSVLPPLEIVGKS